MKKIFLLLVAVLASSVTVDQKVTVKVDTWTIANNLATNVAALATGGAWADPSGIPLREGGALAACVSATSGQTITSGNFRAYVWMPVDATSPPTYRWVKYPTLDWAPSTGTRDSCSGDRQVLSGIGRLAYVEDDIVVSGGATITVTYSMRSGLPR